jgi:hypothetical protein
MVEGGVVVGVCRVCEPDEVLGTVYGMHEVTISRGVQDRLVWLD